MEEPVEKRKESYMRLNLMTAFQPASFRNGVMESVISRKRKVHAPVSSVISFIGFALRFPSPRRQKQKKRRQASQKHTDFQTFWGFNINAPGQLEILSEIHFRYTNEQPDQAYPLNNSVFRLKNSPMRRSEA